MIPSIPMVWSPGAPELVLIVLVIVLLFGAKKLPDLARGTGRALRIFKSETKGLMDDDDKPDADRRHEEAPRPLSPGTTTTLPPQTPPSDPAHTPVEDATQRPTER
jgi:sec-independent protein translocase protein TatA